MSIVYCLESPKDNSSISYGMIIIEGWVFSTSGNVQKIEVIDNKQKYYATIGLKREDVAACHNSFEDKAKFSGFRLEIPLDNKQLIKDHFIKIRIITDDEVKAFDTIKVLGSSTKKTKANIFHNYKKAINRTKDYLSKGNFPKNIGDLKICFYKFRNMLNEGSFNIKMKGIEINLSDYELWMSKNNLDDRKISIIKQEVNLLQYNPLISIVIPTYKSEEKFLRQAIEAVTEQLYKNWELIIVDDCTPGNYIDHIVEEYMSKHGNIFFYKMEKNSHISLTTNHGVENAKGDFIFLMDHDDLITKDALYEVVGLLNKNNDLDIIYSDDDKISVEGKRYEPQFKPDFSPELLLSYMYFSHIFVIRKSLYDMVGGLRVGLEGSQDFDLALRLTEISDKVGHIPKILYHWRATPSSTAFSTKTKSYSLINGLKAVEEAVQRRGLPAKVVVPDFAEKASLGIFALKYKSDNNPLVSIIIPNKNHTNILSRCIKSIEDKTTYKNYEIIIVDNMSDELECLRYLEKSVHKVIKCENKNGKFNFSRMVNYGVENCKGEYIILLNNDTEVISSSWIEDMLVYMTITNVGVVGSKLLYPDGLVQHAGVVLKMFNDIAGHAFKLIEDWDGGYLSYSNVARNYTAVTAACFMTSKAIYNSVNGFDEEDFGVSFNDVDFCMKVIEKGYRITYNPQALLYHHEGKSRGVEQTGHFSDPKEEFNFINKWKINENFSDKYYNPNLSLQDEKFRVSSNKVVVTNRKNLNILLITHNLNYEGAPLMQLNICRNMVDKGYTFTVLSPFDGAIRKEYESAGINVIIEDIMPHRDFLNKNEYNSIIEKLSRKYAYADLIYTNTIETFWGVELANKMGIPSIWGIHESVDYKTCFSTHNSGIAKLAVDKFSSATKVAFVAESTQKMYLPLSTNNFKVIKNGIDINKVENYIFKNNRDEKRRELGISDETEVISIFGAVCMRKGQDIFIKAANQIIKDGNKNVFFLIVGAKQSPYLDMILQYVKENDIQNYVKVIYVCEDIYQYYLISDVFVCASYEESSPQVILEAMAFKIPIVSTNVFGIPELIRDNREALLTDEGNSKKMGELITRVISDKKLKDELSYNAYYRVKTNFTSEKMVEKYDNLFQQSYLEGNNFIYNNFLKGD